MNFENMLPIGSVVLLKDGKKKIVIMGVMQIKPMDDGRSLIYDYMGVPYPEGFMGRETGLLFNHDKIQEVFFIGYSDPERENFVSVIQKMLEKTEKHIEE